MTHKYIALTFDDGPSNVTNLVLDKLEKHNIIATFFIVGKEINEDSEKATRRAFEMGCDIENHSQTHSVMTELTREQIIDEIAFTSSHIKRITGREPMFFRPPYIAVNQEMKDAIPLTFIAGIGCNDWEDSVSPKERTEKILAQVSSGNVILMHDMTDNTRTVEALDMLVPKLKELGYEFVTVEKLFELYNVSVEHSKVYTNVFQEWDMI